MNLETIKENVGALWDSMAEGWRHLTQSAAGALTRFRSSSESGMPARSEVDDSFYLPSQGWAMLGGDVFEDDRRLVVRLEVPGMRKEDINIEVLPEALVVTGEKRFEKENTEGRWRVMQCAYGSFRRVVPLPSAVLPDQAMAAYRDGVLRIELPKEAPSQPKGHTIRVS